ncbi:hypothetical protein ACS8YF_12600 [Salinisphaera sp. SWV1]|uniref:hypothetical protein n=1 Tax=Salinisphaera sp. SWV1 TaxID=3454139 RepID=UPI003F87B7F2
MPLAGLAGIGDEVLNKAGITKAKPSDVIHNVENDLTYQPKTQKGQEVTHYINMPFDLLNKGGKAAGDWVYNKTGSPIAATAVQTAIDGAPALIGLKGLGRGKADVATDTAASPAESAKPEAKSAPETTTGSETSVKETPLSAGDNVTVDGLKGNWTVEKPSNDGLMHWVKNDQGERREVGNHLITQAETKPADKAPEQQPQPKPVQAVDVGKLDAAIKKPPFLRTPEDKVALRNIDPRTADILRTPPFLRSPEDRVYLNGVSKPTGDNRAQIESRDSPDMQANTAEHVAAENMRPSAAQYLDQPTEHTQHTEPSTHARLSANPMFDPEIYQSILGPAYERARAALEAHVPEEKAQGPIPELDNERQPIPTDNVEKALHILRNHKTLDNIDALNFLRKAKEAGMTPEINRKLMDYVEEKNLPESQRTTSLTPEEQHLHDTFIAPIRNALDHKDGYAPREARGKGGKLDLLREKKSGRFGVGTLRKSLPSMKHRLFKALTDENGNRTVVAAKRQGKDYALTAFHNKHPESFGTIKATTGEDELNRKIKPIDVAINKLRHEKNILSKTQSRRHAARVRLANIEDGLNALYERKAKLQERHADELNDQFFTHKGKRYHIGEATANEIEKHTNVKYHRNLLGKLLDEYVANRQVQRQTKFLDDLKASPEFQKVATQDPTKAKPKWKSLELPQFHGWKAEPYTAEVLNHFARRTKGDLRVPILSTVNDLARKAMFSVLPVWHDFNIADMAIINRGMVGNFSPASMVRLWKTMGPAMKEVMTLGPKYQRLMEKGAPFMYAKSKLGLVTPEAFGDIVNSLGTELDAKPELHPIAKALGFVPGKALQGMKWWGHHANTSMWSFNDMAIMQAIMERELKGMSEDDALMHVTDILPSYSLPEGSRLLNVLTHPDMSWFARYHLGLFKAYGKMMQRVLGKSSDASLRARGMDQLAMVGLMGLVVYPMLDQILRQQSGDPKAHVARFGLSAIPYDLSKWASGQMALLDFGTKIFTPAPGSYEALQQLVNRDIWSGDEIAPYYSTRGEAAEDRIKHLTHMNIPAQNFVEGNTPLQGLGRQFGIEIPKSEPDKRREKAKEREKASREKHRYFQQHRS